MKNDRETVLKNNDCCKHNAIDLKIDYSEVGIATIFAQPRKVST